MYNISILRHRYLERIPTAFISCLHLVLLLKCGEVKCNRPVMLQNGLGRDAEAILINVLNFDRSNQATRNSERLVVSQSRARRKFERAKKRGFGAQIHYHELHRLVTQYVKARVVEHCRRTFAGNKTTVPKTKPFFGGKSLTRR